MDTIPKIVLQNPFRILGVYANSARRDIVANKGKTTAFLKVNRPVEFPLDLKGLLPPITRTLDSMNEAEAHLAIAKEQIKYAQFWFLKMIPLDEIAFNHLFAGKIDEAISIWSKQDNISSLQNKMICYLIKNSVSGAISTAQQLYEKYGDSYISKIEANCTFKMSGTELLHQFVDSLGEEIGMQKLLSYEMDADTKAYISNQAVGPLINKISSEVEKTKKVDHKDPKARIDAARRLVTSTKESFTQLKSMLPMADPQFQMIADKLGLEILQCGIDYFNNSEDDDAPHAAMKIQKYAQSVVAGTMAKQRCEENVKILQKIIDQLPPKEVLSEDKAIKAELAKFVRLPDKISYSVNLLNATKSHLQSIKRKLGINNDYYLKISTQVVSNALHNVIEEVNEAQQPLAKISEILGNMDPRMRSILLSGSNEIAVNLREIQSKVKSTLGEAWKATLLMDEFDLDNDFKSRYKENRSTLKSLCDNMGVSTYVSRPPTISHTTTSSSSRPKTSGSSSSSDTNWGCIIGFVVAILGCLVGAVNGNAIAGLIVGGIIGLIILGNLKK